MLHLDRQAFRHLDHCLSDLASLAALRAVLEKIDRCCAAVKQRMNLGDVLNDPANCKTIRELFGEEGLEAGLQLILKIALKDHLVRSFTVQEEIQGAGRMDLLFRAVGGWKQFDVVLALQARGSVVLLNPAKSAHWKTLASIPAGTLVTVYIKTLQGKRIEAQEQLAAERYEAIFETVHAQPEPPVAVAVVTPIRPATAAKPSKPATATKRPSTPKPRPRPMSMSAVSGPPCMEFQVVINKMDTFVHAGNAHMIISHIHDYPGQVQMFVLRDTKKKLSLDADSIWSAEIRNGERVLFAFFGPLPSEQYVKELAKKVNKYTQMDKVAHE